MVGLQERLVFWIALVAALAPMNLKAGVLFPSPSTDDLRGRRIEEIPFFDEFDRSLSLESLRDRRFVIVPFFSQCGATCSLMVPHLREVVGERMPVLALSMDPDESRQDLEAYRNRFHLPPNWILGRVSSLQSQGFWEQLQFSRVETQPRQFAHPTMIYIVSKGLQIESVIYGLDFGWKELESSSDLRLWSGWALLVAAIGLGFFWILRRRTSKLTGHALEPVA